MCVEGEGGEVKSTKERLPACRESFTHPPGTVLLLLHQRVSQGSDIAECLVTLGRRMLQIKSLLLQFIFQLHKLRGGGGGGERRSAS